MKELYGISKIFTIPYNKATWVISGCLTSFKGTIPPHSKLSFIPKLHANRFSTLHYSCWSTPPPPLPPKKSVPCKESAIKVKIKHSFVTSFQDRYSILLFRYIYGARIIQWFCCYAIASAWFCMVLLFRHCMFPPAAIASATAHSSRHRRSWRVPSRTDPKTNGLVQLGGQCYKGRPTALCARTLEAITG